MTKVALLAIAIAAFSTFLSPCFAQDAPAAQEDSERRRPFDLNVASEALRSSEDARPAGTGLARAQTVEERIGQIARQHLARCWRIPIDLPNSQRVAVTVRFNLHEDGSLSGRPQVVSPTNYGFDRPMGIAVERALEAVERCSPFPFAADPMLAQRYENWRTMELRFGTP